MPSTLVASYSFNEGSGTTANDSSGNGHNGTCVNTTWVTPGKYDKALSFDGTSARVDVPDAAPLRLTTGMTLEGWFNPTSIYNYYADGVYKGNDNFYLCPMSGGGGFPVAGGIVDGVYSEAFGTTQLPANTWTHLAATFDGSTMRLYVNGSLAGSNSRSGSLATSTSPLQIGGDTVYSQYFLGQIDEVRVYDVALSQAQIQADMNTPVGGGADTVPPYVTGTSPVDGAAGVPANAVVLINFSEAMDASTINGSTVQLTQGGNPVTATVGYDSSHFVATLTPASALSAATGYQVLVKGGGTTTVKDVAGNAMTANFYALFTTAGASPPGTLTLQDFSGTSLPTNGDGDGYPNIAPYNGGGGPGGPEGASGVASLDSVVYVTSKSFKADLSSGANFYLQFNPYNYSGAPAYPGGRSYARDYATGAAQWQFNYYNRLSFWMLLPDNEVDWSPYLSGPQAGNFNFNVGTYVKQITNSDPSSDEAGGGHYYHGLLVPSGMSGHWTYVVLNAHASHQRGVGGDPGNRPYPTTVQYGGTDPDSTYNYFDTLTRFYLEDNNLNVPSVWHADDFLFVHEPGAENDTQVFGVTCTYRASDNRLILTWSRDPAGDTVSHEVRYAFSDIHQSGWAAATPAPGGTVSGPGSGLYMALVYDNSALPLSGQSFVYLAVKPQNSGTFTQIRMDLTH